MPTIRLRKKPSVVALGIGISLLVAVGIAALVLRLTASPLPNPTPTPAEQAYSIDPAQVALTAADVGSHFPLVNEGAIGPTQMSLFPLPYQRQFFGGWARNFIVESALVPPGRTEIETYEMAHGFPPTTPPTIFGPFVADHSGLFEISSVEQSYHLASAAHPDYLCCDGNYSDNYDNWRTYPIQLGDEADAWGGIRRSPTNPPQNYEEQTFRIRWRRGPVVSTIFIRGAHDLTLDQGVHFARIVDQRIASALQQATKGASYVSNPRDVAALVAVSPALCDFDGGFRERVDWT